MLLRANSAWNSSPRHVPATCPLVCADLKPHLRHLRVNIVNPQGYSRGYASPMAFLPVFGDFDRLSYVVRSRFRFCVNSSPALTLATWLQTFSLEVNMAKPPEAALRKIRGCASLIRAQTHENSQWFRRWQPFTPKSDQYEISPTASRSNMTSHSMENLAFHSLLRWKMIVLYYQFSQPHLYISL